MSLIQMHDVTKTYQAGETRVEALRGINLEINEGAFISFIGPSGSGKSTLLNVLGCLDKPTGGDIIINDVKINNLNRKESADFRGDNLGFIFQNFNLIQVLTVYENIEYPLLMVQNIPTAERKDRILNLLDKVGMSDQKDKLPSQISGGQKQRVAVARALVTNPKLVLADEPTANLDHKTAFKIIETMHAMQKLFGTTFIFATHDPKIVGEAEIIYTLEDGLITDKTTPNNLGGN
ncbi:MAG: ABC transporter ATP-binding protein [Candidatus Margulisiibacteriota bacterium]|nr:MAG: ABC transporter [Candidatus Margulisbacteria bacterium GWD2_39_127]OGI02236.1 MAG: ABC transporter [Candidatus Margulisbacteria bacterium GWF2_38_17]OGI11470.1 MAG: ABC transporter [Candidatus Margulisbacteria bacterium GWE2_39_32]PZM81945.1 MAG: ABC transporter ATP-binding protein [Candidatus Margulisiibacteriota bacterium]HAR63701.1 ABC transporter [Candidatus Margulisiibacteriota bacterium]